MFRCVKCLLDLGVGVQCLEELLRFSGRRGGGVGEIVPKINLHPPPLLKK